MIKTQYTGKSMNKIKRLNQVGMVSFTVTLIMMMVITLIVIAFAEVTRHSEREALDRQLSAQAFYAAESGVNVTQTTITNFISKGGDSTAMPTKQTCDNEYDPTASGGVGGTIQALTTGVSYSCVLVNPKTNSLIYDVSTNASTVARILSDNGPLTQLKVRWYAQAGVAASNCSATSATSFPKPAAWTSQFGILRLDLAGIANPTATNLSSASFSGNTATVYFTPCGTAPAPTITASVVAYVVSGNCSTGSYCDAQINLPGSSANYYGRLSSMYRDAKGTTITATANNGGSNMAAEFAGSQAIVDVTGKAQDELRRTQVRVNLAPDLGPSDIPSTAVGSNATICKRFSIATNTTINDPCVTP